LEHREKKKERTMTKNLEDLIEERRGKLIPISGELVMDCILTKEPEITRIARVSLPFGLHVTGTFYDPESGCFMFIIYSEEFDLVPSGKEFPLFHDYEMVSLKVVESGGATNR
jgi:hypothetical protein